MLSLAVGEALEHNPENVLRLTIPAFDIAVICGGPDIDGERYNSLELAIKAIENRAVKVASIKDVSLSSLRKTCLQFLEDSKKDVGRFYGSKKEMTIV